MDWFNALRAARFHYLQVAFPGASDADVSGEGSGEGGRHLGWVTGLNKGINRPLERQQG